MYKPLSAQRLLYVLPGLTFQRSTVLCFVWLSEPKTTIFLYRITKLNFITEAGCVYCTVRIAALYLVQVNCRLSWVNAKMYACMYVCTYVRMLLCMYVRMHVCMYYVRMYVCTYVCMYVRMYVCTYVCMYLRMCVCIKYYVCTYVFMYVRMYVCMYVCMHACTYILRMYVLGMHACTYIRMYVRTDVYMYVHVDLHKFEWWLVVKETTNKLQPVLFKKKSKSCEDRDTCL